MRDKQKYIYIVISQTLTIPGKFIRKFTGGKYSHASISLDKDLNEMYSFARFHYQAPLIGGFTKESLTSLSLGKNEEVYVKIFEIPVTSYQYKKIKNNIKHFKENQKVYMYNLFALVFYPMKINFKIRDSYVCTEFVSQTLINVGIKPDELSTCRYLPDRMVNILAEYELYNGSLQEYTKTVDHHDVENNYLERENFILVVCKSIKQLGKLIFRKFI